MCDQWKISLLYVIYLCKHGRMSWKTSIIVSSKCRTFSKIFSEWFRCSLTLGRPLHASSLADSHEDPFILQMSGSEAGIQCKFIFLQFLQIITQISVTSPNFFLVVSESIPALFKNPILSLRSLEVSLVVHVVAGDFKWEEIDFMGRCALFP